MDDVISVFGTSWMDDGANIGAVWIAIKNVEDRLMR